MHGDHRVETCLSGNSRRLVELEQSQDRKPSSIGSLVPPGREVGNRCRALSTGVPQSQLGLNSITKLMFEEEYKRVRLAGGPVGQPRHWSGGGVGDGVSDQGKGTGRRR